MRAKDVGYLAVFVAATLPTSVSWMVAHGVSPELAAYYPLLFVFVLVPIADRLLGFDRENPDPAEAARLERSLWLRALTWICVPLWLALLAYGGWHFAQPALGLAGKVGWLLSTGIIGAILAINVAHELVHKAGSFEPALGGILLTSVGYQGFKIEHVRGHHVHVATPVDASSARLGERIWRFVPRALVKNTLAAWKLEAERLTRAGRSVFSWRNELFAWSLLWLAMLAAFTLWLGALGALFFVADGLIAAASLEVINYVEHYGLSREQLPNGRYAPVSHRHSWNSSARLTNLMLFQLQRHADHHQHARRRYGALVHLDDAPQLPFGYATMYVIALVPPLWHRMMDPRARALVAR
jgi:alkane 1-monooxygenase